MTPRSVAILATDDARRDLAFLALQVPFLEIHFIGRLGQDRPDPRADIVVVATGGSGREHRDILESLADTFPVFLVVDDPAWARSDQMIFAGVVASAEPMTLFNVIRRHLEIGHDAIGPSVICRCGRRLPILHAAYDRRTRAAAVHCEHCQWANPLPRVSSTT